MKLVLITLAGLCGTTTAMAQVQNVPRDLVLSLFAHQSSVDSTQQVEILIGKAPENLPLPQLNLPIIGAVKYADAVTIVYRVTGDLKETHRRAKAQLREAGWQDPPGAEPPPDAGFVGSVVDMSEFMNLCRDDAMVMIEPVSVRTDLRVLKVMFYMDGCGTGQSGWVSYSAPRTDTPLPKLEPPKGAQVFGAAVPGGISSLSTSAFIVSDLSTPKLLEHYGTQMLAHGWSHRGSIEADPLSVRSWRITKGGKEWMASMIATKLLERQHVIEINVYPLSELGR